MSDEVQTQDLAKFFSEISPGQQDALNVCADLMVIALKPLKAKPIKVLSEIEALFYKLREEELAGK